jgi:GrpB-like predicted nucleotidyltransferase (UPF0157 family)
LSARLEIVAYDPRWPELFEAEAGLIRQALGPLAVRIDHHGSTAVPGLAAKAIIDIQVSVPSLQPLDAFGPPLEAIGYLHVPHADDAFCPFFHRPADWPHTHHVHVVESGGGEERRTLAFRDYLRAHADAAREYERLKRTLAAQSIATDRESREAYARAKADFIGRIVATALSERGRTPALSLVEESGVRVVEGAPNEPLMTRVDDASRVIEACFSHRARLALLYASNLTERFFDLSSGDAGAILQKLRNYGVRLAVVCPPGSVQFSSRFGEMLAEEHRRRDFRVFETRAAAREWLSQS